MDDETLHGHLQHHWAAATGGVALFERVGKGHSDREASATVRAMAVDIEEDRESLRRIMTAVGLQPSLLGALGAHTAEAIARLKPNGHVLRRSPLSDVLELEALRTAVSGKRMGWQLLRVVADHDERVDGALLDELLRRADSQLESLEDLHRRVCADRALD